MVHITVRFITFDLKENHNEIYLLQALYIPICQFKIKQEIKPIILGPVTFPDTSPAPFFFFLPDKFFSHDTSSHQPLMPSCAKVSR